jgi:Flp pilus assembly pilin Flp
MTDLFRKLWSQEEAQDIAEYAVMLAVILVIVVGTLRLIGGSANNVTTKTGNADSTSNIASHPGSAQMETGFHSTQSAVSALHCVEAGGCLFRGSESRRMDDHRKYRPLGFLSSRLTFTEL